MAYTQVWNPMLDAIDPNIILRDKDGAFIPADPRNRDYVAYQEWLTKGNTPKPYTPPEPQKAEPNG